MLRAQTILPAGHWPRDKVRDTVTLPHDERFRRRRALTGDWGTAFLLDLPDAAMLHHGDGLALDDGGIVEVVAAKEKLLEVRAGPHIGLARLAWHVGNRHLAAQIEADRLLLAADHVIADMLRGLGAAVREIEAPFTPEGGAYGHAQGAHGHHHHDGHDHGHSH